jgi:arylformamidase
MAKKSNWIDVSVPVHNKMHFWHGDPPPFVTMFAGTAKGDVCNVSVIHCSFHTGTHMDAPWHFLPEGKTLDDIPFDAVIGPCRVVEIKDKECVKPAELKKLKLKKGERILLKTLNSTVSWKKETFDKDFVYISKEGAQYLVDAGIQTIGIDYLSVGGFYKDGIETHHVLLGAEVWIIEGIDLSKVKPGNYDLICLPVKFAKADGAPARCLVRPR